MRSSLNRTQIIMIFMILADKILYDLNHLQDLRSNTRQILIYLCQLKFTSNEYSSFHPSTYFYFS